MGTIEHLNTHDSHILEPLIEQVFEKVGKPEQLPQVQLIKHQRLQATYLTKKSHLLYPIHVLEQKKDPIANMTMFTMNTLIFTFATSGETLKYSNNK
ncbi:Uncharacterised protein [Chlamydia trachomatis]|nr:Uncharacterised protein [Chlamydia trachomatis]